MAHLLIYGTLPPPIGGVSIYCKRLCEELDLRNVKYTFIDINKTSFFNIFVSVTKYRTIHINTSNPLFRLSLVVLAKLLFKKVIITFHGDIGRFNAFKNFLDRCSLKLCNTPITINMGSYEKAIGLNSNSKLSSAFFKPRKIDQLKEKHLLKIKKLKSSNAHLFCSNAYDVSFDKNGQETYQISNIINIFNRIQNKAFILSDPSSNYLKYLKSQNIIIPKNVFIIDESHDFNAVLRECDAFIRYTTTDGDSISVKEALSLKRQVIASGVVSRPKGVTVVNDLDSLKAEIRKFYLTEVNLTEAEDNLEILLNAFDVKNKER